MTLTGFSTLVVGSEKYDGSYRYFYWSYQWYAVRNMIGHTYNFSHLGNLKLTGFLHIYGMTMTGFSALVVCSEKYHGSYRYFYWSYWWYAVRNMMGRTYAFIGHTYDFIASKINVARLSRR